MFYLQSLLHVILRNHAAQRQLERGAPLQTKVLFLINVNQNKTACLKTNGLTSKNNKLPVYPSTFG